MKALFKFLQDCLKVKEWWKFYGILFFLAFLAYLLFGGGIGHLSQVKQYLTEEPVTIETTNE